MATNASGPTTPRQRHAKGLTEAAYHTPEKQTRRAGQRAPSLSPASRHELQKQLARLPSEGNNALYSKCRQYYDEDSPISPVKADTAPTLMRLTALALLDLFDGNEDDVPDVLRGALSAYRDFTQPELKKQYRTKLNRKPPSNYTKNHLLADLVRHDREHAHQQRQANYEDAERLRHQLTEECYETIMNPSLGLLRSAATYAKTLFGWCTDDLGHVPLIVLQNRVEFLKDFDPKRDISTDGGQYTEDQRQEQTSTKQAVWKHIRDILKYLRKCVGMHSNRADLFVRTSASLSNLNVFKEVADDQTRVKTNLRHDNVSGFYSNKENLGFFIENAPAHLRQQQCRALIEIKQKFLTLDPISASEQAAQAARHTLLQDFLHTFKVDIRSTYYSDELPSCANTRQHLAAIHQLRGSNDLERAIIAVLPTGAGKTGIISLAGFTCNAQRVLVIVPNLEILKGMSECFCGRKGVASTFFEKCGLNNKKRRFPSAAHGLPKTAILSASPNANGLQSNVDQCIAERSVERVLEVNAQVVLTNIHQLTEENLCLFPTNYFDLVIFDEGHHGASTTYRAVQDHFRSSYQLLLTATPFRSDRAGVVSLRGDDSQYRGSDTTAAEAIARKIITNIVFEPVPVASFDVVATTSNEAIKRAVGQEQILNISTRKEIQYAATYSQEVRASIMLTALRRLRLLREQETSRRHHYIIAAAPTIFEAEEIVQLWRALPESEGLTIEYVHSEHLQKDDIMSSLREGRIDVIVQVNMLGEGFDLPALSVACAFKVFRSIGPFMQFVGRVMRMQSGGDPTQIQRAYFIAHPCMRYDKHFAIFREERQDAPRELQAKGSVENIDIVNHVMAAHPPDAALPLLADEVSSTEDIDYQPIFRRWLSPSRVV